MKYFISLLFISLITLLSATIYNIYTAVILMLFSVAFTLYQNIVANKKNTFVQSISQLQNDKTLATEQSFRKILFLSSTANLPLVPILFFVLCTHFLIIRTGVSLNAISAGLPVAKELILGLLKPNFDLLNEAVTVYARQTLEVTILGTIIAFCLALPISFLSSWHLMNHHIITKCVYYVFRIIMVTIRSIPTFLLGLIFVAIVGLGSFPGVLAIIMFSTGIMVKLFSESIESINAQMEQSQGDGE